MRLLTIAGVVTLCLWLTGCNDPNTVYKAYEDIDDGLWYVNNTPTFKIEITDSTQRYNLYYLVRNGLQYPYYNLYLTRKITGPDGQVLSARLEELYLSNETTGKPYGSGLGDLFDHKIPFLQNYRFPRTGTYTLTIEQSMRQNPLPFILGIGVSVEKAGPGTP
ncbi:gliding motility lipoprotein GldH [Telluribacter sp.]|jgi:gliding motility-associated lipoprotein GldH|uniref:gliding motility lipoprotein GldH n=1 Tax=Telluribacter sp. TaxID=1978767 RepID=UPI002E11A75F|nr:gliding motility lipoprotein GldH [Telluribacter sp.]